MAARITVPAATAAATAATAIVILVAPCARAGAASAAPRLALPATLGGACMAFGIAEPASMAAAGGTPAPALIIILIAPAR
jgi:hypothetical protein